MASTFLSILVPYSEHKLDFRFNQDFPASISMFLA